VLFWMDSLWRRSLKKINERLRLRLSPHEYTPILTSIPELKHTASIANTSQILGVCSSWNTCKAWEDLPAVARITVIQKQYQNISLR
jgi:hypothetical protein